MSGIYETIVGQFNALDKPYKIVIVVIIGIVGLSLLSKWADNYQKYPRKTVKLLENLTKQSTQWYIMATQDANPMIALMHVNYALAYLFVARSYASPEEIRRLLSININEMIETLEDVQQKAIQTLSQKCPSIRPESQFTVTAGWI